MTPAPELEHVLAEQVGADAAAALGRVLDALVDAATAVLGPSLVGVYLTGSFALGVGDDASDVDVLVVSDAAIAPEQEAAIRAVHARLPDRPEHWARHLEGSWVPAAALRDRVGVHPPWLYVDNGSRTMEHSRHDDTENARWVLRHAGIPLHGPDPADLVPAVDPDALRAEAREQADLRARWIRDEPEVLHDAWAQPYVVLTAARLLWAAEFGTVAGKADAARWVAAHVAPDRFRELLLAAIRDRRTAASSTTNRADPALVGSTRAFVAWATRETAERAGRRRDDANAASGA